MQGPARVLFCRLGIILFCLLPTATVGGWIVQRSSGSYAIAETAEWERELTGRLGLIVEIERVTYPSFAVVRLDNMRLLDAETRAWVAQIPVVEIIAAEAGWQIEARQPQIAAERLSDLAGTLDQRLLHGPPDAISPCVLRARELTIIGENSSLTLNDVQCRAETTSGGPHATLAFHLPGDAASAAGPVQFAVSRNRRESPPATQWSLHTAGHWLPISMLANLSADATRLGDHCRFVGKAVLVESRQGYSGEWSGTLEGLDFDTLVTERFPHQLSGVGAVKIERAAIENGRLVELRGTLQANNGAISHSLLTAAQEHLRLVLAADNASIQPGRLVPFRRLAIGFHLDGRAIALTGSADATQEGILLANAAGPLLQAPPQHAVPAVNLLRTLLPDNQYQVPATRQTDALVSLLPVPEVTPARTAAGMTAHTPTRLAPASPATGAPAIHQPALR